MGHGIHWSYYVSLHLEVAGLKEEWNSRLVIKLLSLNSNPSLCYLNKFFSNWLNDVLSVFLKTLFI